jgi:hypothetical protein
MLEMSSASGQQLQHGVNPRPTSATSSNNSATPGSMWGRLTGRGGSNKNKSSVAREEEEGEYAVQPFDDE